MQQRRPAAVLLVVLLLVAVVVAAGGSSRAAAETSPPPWTTERLAGADRYASAAAISKRGFPSGADHVVVASGESFADALAATPLAAALGAPLLLTRSDDEPLVTIAELQRLSPSHVFVVGGTAAVSEAARWRLSTIAPSTRVAGADRVETAAAVSRVATFGAGEVPVAFVAHGWDFPDALAAGAVAARLGGPVLLTARDHAPAALRTELARLDAERIVVVGGTAAVSPTTFAQVEPLAERATQRVAGTDRFATAAALAAQAPTSTGTAYVASGRTFPDALAVGPVAALGDGSLLLTSVTCLPTSSLESLVEQEVERVVVVGGTAAVADDDLPPCDEVAAQRLFGPTTTTTSTTEASGGGGGGGGSDRTTTTTSTTTSTSTTTTTTTEPPPPAGPSIVERFAIPGDAPDPAVLKVGDRWYAYSTQVGFFLTPVRTSTDLVTWSGSSNAMGPIAPWATWGRHWAPSVVATDDGFVLWYSAHETASGLQCVSRAVSDDPMGPFVDDLSAPPICQRALGGSIDPFVFTDDDGTRYLYWKSDENALGNPSRLWAQPLVADATAVTGSPQVVLSQGGSWEVPTMEQPAVVRDGDEYHLFYAGGWWESATYGIGHATGSSPLGPFTKRTTTAALLATLPGSTGPGALDPFVGPDGDLWAAFHAWPGPVGYANGGVRTTRLAELAL